MNMAYEEDELKPYIEPEPEFNDLRRMGQWQRSFNILCFMHFLFLVYSVLVYVRCTKYSKTSPVYISIIGFCISTDFVCIICIMCAEILTGMGYGKTDIEDSLKTQKYDDIFATYLLLGRRASDVSVFLPFLLFLDISLLQKDET